MVRLVYLLSRPFRRRSRETTLQQARSAACEFVPFWAEEAILLFENLETKKIRLEIGRDGGQGLRNVIHVRLRRGAGCWTAMHGFQLLRSWFGGRLIV